MFESEQKKEEIKKKKRDANAIYSVDVESVFERDKIKDKKKSSDNKKKASNGDEEKKASDSTKDMDIVKPEADKMEIEENKENDDKKIDNKLEEEIIIQKGDLADIIKGMDMNVNGKENEK